MVEFVGFTSDRRHNGRLVSGGRAWGGHGPLTYAQGLRAPLSERSRQQRKPRRHQGSRGCAVGDDNPPVQTGGGRGAPFNTRNPGRSPRWQRGGSRPNQGGENPCGWPWVLRTDAGQVRGSLTMAVRQTSKRSGRANFESIATVSSVMCCVGPGGGLLLAVHEDNPSESPSLESQRQRMARSGGKHAAYR